MSEIEYNKKCNKYFKTNLIDKYNILFYSNNNFNFIILKPKNNNDIKNEIWVTYKICCVYDISNHFLLRGDDMIIIEKDVIDNNIIFNDKKIKNINDLENQIYKQIFNYGYIGYIRSNKNNVIYYYLIQEIIKD